MDKTMMIFWGILLAFTVVVEICTVQAVSIWFAAAALVSLLLALLGAPVWAQITVFIAVTILLLIFTKDIAKRIFRTQKTNTDLDIGKTATVTEDIDNERQTGRATLSGVSWMARSASGDTIPAGSIVIVEAIDSAKLIVRTSEQEKEI